jgi:8-oxo-dGTP pyrophosphatase MutT (NUDIX family)
MALVRVRSLGVVKRRIRVKSLAVVVRRNDHALLVSRGTNTTGGDFVRLLGGSIEFGESAIDAVQREFREELGSDLESLRLLGVLENRFELDGDPGHEVIFVFHGVLSDPSLYDVEEIPILDVPGLCAQWWIPSEAPHLVPAGLADLLKLA